MGSRIRAILLTGVLVLVSCTSGASDPTTTIRQTTTTTAVRSPSEVCSGEQHTPVDPGALAAQSLLADLDDDGFDDTVTGYLLGASDPAEADSAILHVELASGWGTEIRLDQLELVDGPVVAEPRTVVVMADDNLVVAGVAEIPAGRLYGLFAFEDCRLEAVTTTEGEMPELWVGGGRTHDDWFVCESDRVLMVQFGTSNPDAEPKMYGAGAAQTFEYADGEFTWIRSSDIDAALPATRAEVESLYPPCAG